MAKKNVDIEKLLKDVKSGVDSPEINNFLRNTPFESVTKSYGESWLKQYWALGTVIPSPPESHFHYQVNTGTKLRKYLIKTIVTLSWGCRVQLTTPQIDEMSPDDVVICWAKGESLPRYVLGALWVLDTAIPTARSEWRINLPMPIPDTSKLIEGMQRRKSLNPDPDPNQGIYA